MKITILKDALAGLNPGFFKRWIKHPWYDFKRGIRNLIRWVPIIWKDADWDNDYTLRIFIAKLKFQRDSLAKNNRYEGIEQDLADMTECITLLEQVKDEWENYEEPAWDAMNKKWGDHELIYTELEDGSFQVGSSADQVMTKEEIEVMDKERHLSTLEAWEKRKDDFKRAMKIYAEKSDCWWD